ncbi:anhydro-N-acetylmuramic acid kinase [Bernardetia sp.]|uniref:anhydro-N-acetylmuramic acid kinase n=1 Tax=Bernardetia sp. TaxID=1937974 RepID=UPI0025B858BB|nr:anhydro-N-acetylmuramic acid kinase [Bernardetia sp.]
MKKSYYSIGIMSGTSLDGLDIALCKFENDREKQNKTSLWKYEIINTQFVEYKPFWKEKLQNAHFLSALELKKLETEWTDFVAENVNNFVLQSKEFNFSNLDCISSHGHTIFHQPAQNKGELGFTLQVGNGAMLAAKTGCQVVCDFRQTDVALGGQGAPLVPIGDELLFADYDFCLNLGGIANISFNTFHQNKTSRIAFDICPCNMVLNFLSNQLGFAYDKGGKLAKQGKIDKKLLQKLNHLTFYSESYPKSLGREWVEQNIFPLLHLPQNIETVESQQKIKDFLHTLTYHSAFQIAESIKKTEGGLEKSIRKKRKVLVTGGGAYNDVLIHYLKELSPQVEILKGNSTLIAYKEALIFAFLGVLRLRKQTNTLATVTGAVKDSCGGTIYLAEPMTFSSS